MTRTQEKKERAMRSITVAGAAILAAACLAAGQAASARPISASIVRVGGIAASAEKYFTVNLQPNAGDAGARAVARYYERFGLSVKTSPDSAILFVHGTYGQAAAAGNTSFAAYESMNRRFVGLASPERYPANVAADILATTMNEGPGAVSEGIANGAGGVAPPGGYSPAQLATYYNIQPIYNANVLGAGVNAAILACANIIPADITKFESEFHLGTNVPTIVLVDGGTATTDFEPTGDVERVIGTAPKANVTLYVIPTDCSFGHLADGFAKIAADDATAHYAVVGHSYGATEDSYDFYHADADLTAESADIASLNKQGTTVFVSSGDWGAYEQFSQQLYVGEVDLLYPSSDAGVISVGGTTATSISPSNPTRLKEIAWGLSGGGVSGKFAIPKWQKGTPGAASTTMRNAPDVALDADCGTGYAAVWTPEGGSQGDYSFCGASFAAQTWAGMVALVDSGRIAAHKKTLTNVAKQLYNHRKTTGLLLDMTVGTNGYYLVHAPYCDVTGLGVPNADTMYNTFLALP
jgi:subtilase family serine protease